MVSVIASSIRKGNVVEKEGKLYVVIRAENIHPGKGTPVTHLEMRRISDGVKVNDLKRSPILRAVHAGLRWRRCV